MEERSILIVEDEQTLRRLLEYRLHQNYDVRTAGSGEEAMVLINERPPDLIVSDIMMPGMDGFELQKKLERKQQTRIIPFIFLTAKIDDESRNQGMRTGVDDYITKPFDIEQLMGRIDRLLERTSTFQSQLDARSGKEFSERLIPKELPDEEGYEFYFHMDPRNAGGGDLFDWTKHEDDDYFITIGDVMGKGMKAKFYAFSFLSYVRATLHAVLSMSHSPAELMLSVNDLLMKDEMLEETYASLMLMRWSPKSHTITYANAGHCRPVLITKDGPEIVEYSDMILGLDEETSFHDRSIDLPPDSSFVIYTDGLMEHKMPNGSMLGEDGVLEYLASIRGEENPVQALLDNVLADSDTNEFEDDILVFWLARQ